MKEKWITGLYPSLLKSRFLHKDVLHSTYLILQTQIRDDEHISHKINQFNECDNVNMNETT